MYEYGVFESPTVKNFEGLVKYAADREYYDDEIILVEDQDKEQYLILSRVASLVAFGVLQFDHLKVIWSVTVGECIERLANGQMVEGLI